MIVDVLVELAPFHSDSVLMVIFTMHVSCGGTSGAPMALIKDVIFRAVFRESSPLTCWL